MQGPSSHLFDLIVQNPHDDWSISDIQEVCRENYLHCEPPRGEAYHHKISSSDLQEILTIRAGGPIKPVYVRVFVGFLKKAWEAQS